MPKPQKYRDVAKFLRSQGWERLRQGKGSHEIWGDPKDKQMILSLPHHEVSAGVIRQILAEFPNAPKNWR